MSRHELRPGRCNQNVLCCLDERDDGVAHNRPDHSRAAWYRQCASSRTCGSQAFHWDLMNGVCRFIRRMLAAGPEMDEISQAFVNAGMTGNLHKGGGRFRMLEQTPLC